MKLKAIFAATLAAVNNVEFGAPCLAASVVAVALVNRAPEEPRHGGIALVFNREGERGKLLLPILRKTRVKIFKSHQLLQIAGPETHGSSSPSCTRH